MKMSIRKYLGMSEIAPPPTSLARPDELEDKPAPKQNIKHCRAAVYGPYLVTDYQLTAINY